MPDDVGVAAVDAPVPLDDDLGPALKDNLPPLMGLLLGQRNQRHALLGSQVSLYAGRQSLEALRPHFYIRKSGGKLVIYNCFVRTSTAK